MKKQSNSTYTERLTLRVSKDFLQQLKQKAKDNEMSVAAFVRMILKKELKK